MSVRFEIKLTVTMIVFALIISFLIATDDYLRLREQAIENKRNQMKQSEWMAKYALETIEKAYNLFGNSIVSTMKENSHYLLDLYDQNPNFAEWDFAALKQKLSMDIYIIDSQNVIVYSSFEKDIGVDFSSCCKKLASILDERRKSGQFYHDGIDIEQRTGKLKKYSYMATRDKKYLIELGYALEEGEIFHEFNFFRTFQQLSQSSPSIFAINVRNTGGLLLGVPVNQNGKLPPERRPAFNRALKTGQTTEYRGVWRNEPAIYRYVPYVSQYDKGVSQTKILEIIYNEKDLQAILDEYKKTFAIQLMVILMMAVAISFVIFRWVAKPMHLAFHDSLTGVKNRAAFEEIVRTAISGSKGTTALLMIDLDNFKLVNDCLGHDKGDVVLKCAAQCIRKIARKEDIAVRWGGDEFLLVMPSASKREAEETARRIIEEIAEATSREVQLKGKGISVSIGIALSPEDGVDPETLCKKADLALYRSKEKGKNQYQFYG